MSSFVFIDSQVSDIEALIARLEPGAQVAILDPTLDGLWQIAQALKGVTGLDAIHIVSHGAQGRLYLGNSVLSGETLDRYASTLSTIGAALSSEGDILLYGCDVAHGVIGQSFIANLALYTGADVAASDDPTGASFLGGDADLEIQFGEVTANSVFDQPTLDNASLILAAPDINSIVPFVLPRDMVRSVFPIDQADPLPALSSLPDLVGRWNFLSEPGTPVTVSYGFSASAPAYDPGSNVADPNSYAAYTDEEKANVAFVLAAYQAVAGISFQLVADPGDAQMVFRKVELVPSGFAYFPPASSEVPQNGDVFIDAQAAAQPYIVFHETGHALGLGHAFDPGRPHPEDYGFAGGRYLSVVDQRSVPKPYYVLDTGTGFSFQSIFHPTTPMPLDILALQMLYGQNASTNAGDTLYTYGVNPNFFQTIWDAGGSDTIDLSNQTNPNIVSLVDGSYSSIGLRDPFAGLPQDIVDWAKGFVADESLYSDGSNMLAIAFDAVVENATGGSAGDRLIGNAVANRLQGNGGNDTLIGGAGNDWLNGGAGVDRMSGGPGNDIYIVNKAGDVVVEALNEGTDTVKASVTHTLADNVERLTLTGTSNINGTGNALRNTLIGNAGANELSGGGKGDSIYGKGGMDTLTGGAGADKFYFDTTPGAGNVDLITDFGGTDKVYLDDDVFAGIGPVGALAPSAFVLGTVASTTAQRIIYDSGSGSLYFDADGTGSGLAVQFATLGTHPAISAANFQIAG